MTIENAFLDDVPENLEDSDSTLSFDDWIGQLTPSTRDALVEEQVRQLETAEHRHDQHVGENETESSQILDLLTEIRDLLVSQRQVRDHYSTEQVAQVLGKANWTVREWCRLGRVSAEKRRSGHGRSLDWVISHAELLRIEKDGLLPLPKH